MAPLITWLDQNIESVMSSYCLCLKAYEMINGHGVRETSEAAKHMGGKKNPFKIKSCKENTTTKTREISTRS